MVGRIEAQASPTTHSSSAAPLYNADVICYGIGRFSTSLPSRLQLSVLLALHSSLSLAESRSLLLYDPLLSSLELAVLRSLGIVVIDYNEEAKRRVSRCTVFYMPHCGQALYNNLLWANWPYHHRADGLTEQRTNLAAEHNSDTKPKKDEQMSQNDELSSHLASVHLTSTQTSAPLGHIILIGNQLSTYIEKRSFPSNTQLPSTRRLSRRAAQPASNLSSRCPIHSALPTTAPSPSILSSVCQYECICLLDALGVLRCCSFDNELHDSSEEVRLAFYDTAVQWSEWSEGSDVERGRVEQWLQHPLSEPKPLADDGELVSAASGVG